MYDQPIDIKPLTQIVADMALNFGEGDITTKNKPNARPYGVSMLFAGVDETGPKIFESDPSGTMVGYLAKGVG
jgi:20S proteasome subunit alpha 5